MFAKIFLFPFAIVYDAVTRFRNHLYNIGHKPSFEFDTAVISVGNLSVGGTGKTPMIEYLVRLLKNDFKLSTLSRGYGRRTRGFRFASYQETAFTLGDEPFQLFKKFGDQIGVAVGENRVLGITNILHQNPSTNLILLDDAFQHRSVKPQLSILLSEFERPFFKDFILPAGRLREARKGASRADLIVITKCPDTISKENILQISDCVYQYAGKKKVFFSGIKYTKPIAFGKATEIAHRVILVSGIANAMALKNHVESHYQLLHHFDFNDHYSYSSKDIKRIVDFASSQTGLLSIVTTEKDMVKIADKEFHKFIEEVPWFYLPVELYFLENGQDFDEEVRSKINQL